MGSQYYLAFLMLAVAMVIARSATLFPDAASMAMGAALSSSGCRSWECFDPETEMLLDSEINHRLLRQRTRYISYDALRKNSVPCNRRGQSYYNCNSRQRANPYRRQCSAITRCRRYTH